MKKTSHTGRARIEPLETRIAPAFTGGTVQLANLDGSNGSSFHGVAGFDYAGTSVSAAGDVNGDGFGDFIIGAAGVIEGADAAYVIFGTATGLPADVTLDANFLDGTKGFQILGEVTGDRTGHAVSAAGDVNGDGFDDVIVGAPSAASNAGAAYVVFGGSSFSDSASIALSLLDGSNGFKLSGAGANFYAGGAVGGAGDVNGDGFDDVIVSAPNLSGIGAVFIIYGKAGGFAADLALTGLTAAQGVRINGVATGDTTGFSASGAGDVNGDGLADVIIGALKAAEGGTNRGAAYVVFGRSDFGATFELSTLGGANGFKLRGVMNGDYAGWSVSGAGDVNGDGLDDVIVGAMGVGVGNLLNSAGAAYVVFGSSNPFAPQVDLGTPGIGFTLAAVGANDSAGASVQSAGDVNGDGLADLIVGVPQNTVLSGVGGAQVIFGRTDLGTSPPTFATLDGSNGFRLAGEEGSARAGGAVSSAGDVNGDGFGDLLVGARLSDGGAGVDEGQVYLVYGGPSGSFIIADVAANGKTATFTDVDGDVVTIKTTKGELFPNIIGLIASNPGVSNRAQLTQLDLGMAFEGANITITAKRAGGGDGKVNVGFINAPGVDLGKVTISGDLGKIVAGDGDDAMGLKALTVGSMGVFGGRTGDTNTGLASRITGAVGAVKVAGDFQEAKFEVVDGATAGSGKLASFTVGGSVIGGEQARSGSLTVVSDITNKVGPVTIAGDLRGGTGENSGKVVAGQMGNVTVGGSVIGGAGSSSGAISAFSVGNISLGGSLIGGASSGSGFVLSVGNIGKVSIKGDLIGGEAFLSGGLNGNGNIASVTIGGDVRGGTGLFPGGIIAGKQLGPVSIKGDVIGSEEVPFTIAGGAAAGTTSLAVASVKVGGDFERARVLAGATGLGFTNGRAQVGAISVGGDWIASSVSAGLRSHTDSTGLNELFGNGDDVFIDGGPANGVASIKSVTIKGAARGTFEAGDRYGIVAEQIGSVSIGGVKLPLTKGGAGIASANDLAAIHVGATPDFVVREISRTFLQPLEPDVTIPSAGSLSAFPAATVLDSLAIGDGFKVSGIAANDHAGQSVHGAGDVNGDGFDDFIVSALYAAEGGSIRGAAYVVFGAGGLGSFTLSALNGTNGFKLSGVNDGDRAGYSISAAGDVNGDGFDDVIVGAFHVDLDHAANAGDNRGAAYVVFGRSSFASTAGSFALSALDGTNGIKLLGVATNDQAGFSVGAAGDVNGDGFDDVIVGARFGNLDTGAAYVVFGQSRFDGTPVIGLETLDGRTGFKLSGEDLNDGAGASVSGAGDVNGDGFDDVIVGARYAEETGGNSIGSAYVVFGSNDFTSTPAIGLGTLQGTAGVKFTGVSSNDEAGHSVSGAGDVNGDGFADVIIGAPFANGPGAAYVIFGKSGFVDNATADFSIGLGTLTDRDGFTISGAGASGEAGKSVSGAGDVNGDGFADLIVGARTVAEGGFLRGAAYVIFGKAAGFGTSLSLSTLDGANGFKLSGAMDGDNASRVSAAGDVNGDGFADVIVGASSADPNSLSDAGAAYVVYGGPSGDFVAPIFLSDFKGAVWTDVDGDLVTLKVSKTNAVLAFENFKLLAKSFNDDPAQLLSLTLGSEFEGADVSITAKRAGGGDGKVNVGHLNAFLVDLGNVTISGDLGQIDAGDLDAGAPIKSLTVGSLGVFGGRTQDTGGSLISNFIGAAGPVKIAGDMREATIIVGSTGMPFDSALASVTIGGSLIGGKVAVSGVIAANSLGPVKIGGDIVGGAGQTSGYVQGTSLTSLTLGGDLRGGSGALSGTARILGAVGNVSIGGSQLGGSGLASGALFIAGNLGKVAIKRDQVGGSGVASGIIFTSDAGSNIASATIGGDARGGDASLSGGIFAGGTLGPVSIKGDVIGTAEHAYTIRGSGPLTGAASVALTSLKVGGDFDHALILAGYGADNVPTNGHAQIGAISVGGDWIASSVSAGLLTRSGAPNTMGVFGNGDDVFIIDGTATNAASIASITIKGRAVGTVETGDFFGIVAESIGAAKIGGVKVALTGAADKIALGSTRDFFIREVARV